MTEPKRAANRLVCPSNRQCVSRRRFVRDATVLSVGALAGMSQLAACGAAQPTPTAPVAPQPEANPTAASAANSPAAPAPEDASSRMQPFRDRKSASGFQSKAVPAQVLLELLWAAWGINRPDSGKRTAPSAMNAQEMDIYILLAGGAYLYDHKGNQVTPVVAQDLRARAGAMGAVRDAPVHLIYVADYDRMSRVSGSERELYSAAHSGFIGQNVYLYCAAAGLETRFYAGVDRAALKSALKLRENQAVIFAQAVGYAS